MIVGTYDGSPVEAEWERATDDAAELIMGDVGEFERHVLAETAIDLDVRYAMTILRVELEGNSDRYGLTGKVLLTAYNEAVDRLARRELENK